MANDTVWREYIVENRVLLEKLFASNGWKKALLPWMKAQKDLKTQTLITSKDHVQSDILKGMILAFEQIISLPEGLSSFSNMPKAEERPIQQDATFASEGVYFEEDEK